MLWNLHFRISNIRYFGGSWVNEEVIVRVWMRWGINIGLGSMDRGKLNEMKGTQMMYYPQPSFKETHSLPVKFYSPPAMGEGRTGGQPYYDFSYKPAMWYKR